MAYNSSIPQPTDQLSQSQSQLLDNFAYLLTYLQVDHTDLNSGTLQGKHKKVTLPDQFPSIPTFSGGDVGIYGAEFTTGQNEIWARINLSTGTSTNDIPFSASVRSNNAQANITDTGWTYLPSGLLLKWGVIGTSPTGVSLNIDSGGFLGPNYTTQVFTVLGTIKGSVGGLIGPFSISVTTQPSPGPTTITCAGANSVMTIAWFTIGF